MTLLRLGWRLLLAISLASAPFVRMIPDAAVSEAVASMPCHDSAPADAGCPDGCCSDPDCTPSDCVTPLVIVASAEVSVAAAVPPQAAEFTLRENASPSPPYDPALRPPIA